MDIEPDVVNELREGLRALDERIAKLEDTPVPAASTPTGTFWVLDGLKKSLDPPGGIVFAGAVTVAAGPVEWQITLPTAALLDQDWASFAPGLSALGNPVRLSLLHAVLGGASTVTELSAGEGMGTTGQLYHHLGQLVSSGWLVAGGRGHYSIPAERVVPLLVILGASRRIP